jgi:hypothetical protein
MFPNILTYKLPSYLELMTGDYFKQEQPYR